MHGQVGDAAAHEGWADASEAEPAKGPADRGGFAPHVKARLGDGCDATLNSKAETVICSARIRSAGAATGAGLALSSESCSNV